MTDREYTKLIGGARRSVCRKYGFRQSSYFNFKVEEGYFFCVYFFTGEVRLTVKPMYADDLWWVIWEAQDNKNEPLSLRGTGAFTVSGQLLSVYDIGIISDESEMPNIIEGVFQNVTGVISEFLTANPDADMFYPDETKMDHDPDRLLYLMALIHNGREKEVLSIIKEVRKNKHHCMFSSGLFSDTYSYIREWCHKSLIKKWIVRKFDSMKIGKPIRNIVLKCIDGVSWIC